MFKIENKSIDVKENSLHHDPITVSNSDESEMPLFIQFFWDEQINVFSSSKRSVRYHPHIIWYCLAVTAKSASFYDDISCDGNINTSFLMLNNRVC